MLQENTAAEKNFEVIGLDICGVDIMAENLTQPLKKKKKRGGALFLEVNTQPGFKCTQRF
jgi:cyanophycin synthetase